jgi:crotonobetainyl-CoA:carnitine CoA-transferase CaiB-like acyl-CoA transferase
MAFNLNKRSITLNLENTQGRELFKRLVRRSDFIIESFSPGYLEALGIGYSALETINPGVIMVSITPFGQNGPYRDYKASDIVLWALGGHLYTAGDADRAPVGISEHTQSYLHAGAEAAAAASMALYSRRVTGEGQWVDISIQEVVAALNVPATAYWSQKKAFAAARGGLRFNMAGNYIKPKVMWQCKDGWISCSLSMGPLAVRTVYPLLDWMRAEGKINDLLNNLDWIPLSHDTINQELLDKIYEPITRFFESYTMAELLEGAINRGVMIYPICNVIDITNNHQLAFREFWTDIEHPEINTTIRYPGVFVKPSVTELRLTHRAPLIGEHNRDIYQGELGLSTSDLVALKEAGVI